MACITSRFRSRASVGGPLSGWILSAFRHSTVMAAWQWLFLIEAIPAFVVGFAVLWMMVDKPM